MVDQLSVEVRPNCGKREVRKLRKSGSTPGVLYGHGEKNVCLSVPADALNALIRHGSRLVTLTGAINESVFVREVQWDTWGTHVLHVDFTRVSEHEQVELQVPVELRGEAPGFKEGGVVQQLIHEIQIACPASAVPEKLRVNINELSLGASITVADLPLPEGATVLSDTSAVVVHCIEPAETLEEEIAEAAPGEPEVIGADEEETEET